MLYAISFIEDGRTIAVYIVTGSSEEDAVHRAIDRSHIKDICKDILDKIIIKAQEIRFITEDD